MRRVVWLAVVLSVAGTSSFPVARGQEQRNRPPAFVSPEVRGDRTVTFRLYAPKAETVRLNGGDVPNLGDRASLKKGENGVWETTVGPIGAGAYRYLFDVDGLAIVDPRNPSHSESNNNVWSLVLVPGSDVTDVKDVPHGALATVVYHSSALGRFRRMHVYTPPGYEKGDAKYPVLYLLHGASDSDDSWGTVGRAGVILDNLIAAGKARPMIVVMPHGHTGPFRFRAPGEGRPSQPPRDEFVDDFTQDLKPFVEKTYRVIGDRANRAITGLSMGGSQTLNIAFGHLDEYGYVGVFSSAAPGLMTRPGGNAEPNNRWEEAHKTTLDDPELKKGLKLLWIGCGKDDFLAKGSRATVDLLRAHKFDVTAKDSDGGHTWINWRDYLGEFVPLLFQGS